MVDFPKKYSGQSAQELFDKGYRQTSRKFGIIARVDITREEMIAGFIKENFGDSTSGIPSCSISEQEDHYRRCVSNDSIENVPVSIMKKLRELELQVHPPKGLKGK